MYKQRKGPADDTSYKTTDHFNGRFWDTVDRDDLPSINIDPSINTTIKKNPFRANVEIEKDEVVLNPGLDALFKAKGKTHKGGGIDVMLQPDSFVFSDDKSLSFTERDLKRFEFKEMGGKYKKEKNTPADVLKRNIDVKHYNTLISNISDPKRDDLSKKSSVLMLEKYIATLGNVAFLQEAKKNFPDGLPDFSQGSAPVYNPEVKDEVLSQKQYAKYGGVMNPYLPKLQKGKNKTLRNADGTSGIPMEDPIVPVRPEQPLIQTVPGAPVAPPRKICPCGTHTDGECLPCGDLYKSPVPAPVTGDPQTGLSAPWEFSKWQRLNHGWGMAKLASVKRLMPMRDHLNPSYVDPQLVNPEQTIADMQNVTNQSLNALKTMNPYLRNAQASALSGDMMNKMPGVRTQYDERNSAVINQVRAMNNQTANQSRQVNMKNDQDYYQQVQTGLANYDNMKTYLGDQLANNVNQDVQDNQSLAYNLATLKNPAYGYDFFEGDWYRNKKDIRDVEGGGGKDDMLSLYTNKMMQDWDKLSSTERLHLLRTMTAKGYTPAAKAQMGGKVGYNPYK